MAKYIFSTKFKKIEKEPLYYNIQLTVDKDISVGEYDGIMPPYGERYVTLYKDNPIMLKLRDDWLPFGDDCWVSDNGILVILNFNDPGSSTFRINGVTLFFIDENKIYPLPEILQYVYRNTTFTFTPIPVYE